MKKKLVTLWSVFLLSFCVNAQINKIVAKDGSGDFTTIQASIDAAPTNSSTPWVIFIKNGKYYEKVNIPSNKPNIQLIGESVANVIVFYDDYAGKPTPGGGTLGTQNSASVTINAADFVAVNISFANTFNYDSAVSAGVTGTQAVAVVINADRSAFKNCRFTGMQDTLYTKGATNARHYYYKCYIDGIVDFIFGSSIDVFDSCVIYPKSRAATGNSYITAANTTIGQAYGYVFKDCKIPANTGVTSYYLGRPWNNSTSGITANNKVVFINTTMSSSINPLGWSIWDAGTNTSLINYAEYKSKKFDGTLVDVSNRVAWSKQFADIDTIGYNVLNILNGWNPCSVRTDFCSSPNTEIAVSNFKGIKVGANANFSWNISWPLTGITYELYKSTNNKASFNLLSTITATNDTAINFGGTDAVPPAGFTYYYYVKAYLSGSNTTYTDTIEISSTPTIIINNHNLTNFLQGSTAPSSSQSYILSGVNLLGNITVTAPANFEISIDNANWNTNTIVLNQTSGNVSNTVIYVRLNASSAGNYSGKILHESPSAISDTVFVSGVTQSTPLLSFDVLQQWDFTNNNLDNASFRATGLLPTIPTLNRLNLSNGTQVVAVPAYSSLYGQAIAPSIAGDGLWTTAAGGSGSTLNRTLYEQFTIKPDANYAVRIDSLVALIGYYGSTSGTKIAVVYSKSNFTLDSTDVTSGRDVTGTAFPGTANGGFTKPIIVTASSNGSNNLQYGFALNAGNGVQLNSGETLTIRIYLSCGSTSAGRYAVIKNVQVKGLAPVNLPVILKHFEIKLNNEKQVLNTWATLSEINTSHFNVQRSDDSRTFINVGKVNAVGKSEYNFIDILPNNKMLSTLYYRLEIVDNNGSKTYSDIKNLNLTTLANPIFIYPNPAKNFITIEAKNLKQVNIVDGLGRRIIQLNATAEHQTLSTRQLKSGVYIVEIITTKGEELREKLIIE